MAKENKQYDEDYLNGLIAKAKKSWEGIDVDDFMSDLRDIDAVTIKCRDLMVGDWIAIPHGFAMQITDLGEDYAYANWDGNEGDPWEFCDKDDKPESIPLTPEILEKNGWKETEYWHEYRDGNTIIQYSLSNIWGIINGIEIEHFKCEYVHQLQHLFRLCGLDELADNFKV